VATSQATQGLDHFCRTVLRQVGDALTDGQLLDGFLRNHDEAAFAALVRRHGPMVWGVCRRVLGNHHDAEDAFQAAFLVLVRRAASVVPREMVANWLYGVAHQTALKARTMAAKRRAREMPMAHHPEPAAPGRDPWDDLQPLLDRELSKLPDKYRVAVVLCDLEGKTRKAAARQLKIPEGTVSSRLSTARALLAKRLARHGIALSAGSLAALLTENATSASVPGSVVSAAVHTASLFAAGGAIPPHVAALTEGALTMSRTKLQIATALVLAAALHGFGIGLPSFPATAAGQGQPAEKKTQEGKPKEAAPPHTLRFHSQLDKVDAKNLTISATVLSDSERVYPVADLVVPGKKLDVKTADDLYVALSREPTRLVNLPVANKARITEGGKALKLGGLKAGVRVTLQLAVGPRGLEVVAIHKGEEVIQILDNEAETLASFLMEYAVRRQEVSIKDEKKLDEAKNPRQALQGVWYLAAVESEGRRSRESDFLKAARWVFLGDQIATFDPLASSPENDWIFRYELGTVRDPKQISLVVADEGARQGQRLPRHLHVGERHPADLRPETKGRGAAGRVYHAGGRGIGDVGVPPHAAEMIEPRRGVAIKSRMQCGVEKVGPRLTPRVAPGTLLQGPSGAKTNRMIMSFPPPARRTPRATTPP
jgi:RNA polymerase sigma factor (sigma-70 family)